MKLTSWKPWIKVAVVGALLYLLSSRGFMSVAATKKALGRVDLVLPAFIALLLGSLVTAVRWRVLLGAQTIELSLTRVFALHFVGVFFNVALPGAVSGDVVKAVYVGRERQGARASALSSILLDRVIGLSVLLGLSVVALALVHLSQDQPWVGTLEGALIWFIAFSGVAIAGFYVLLFCVKDHQDPVLKILARAESRIKSVGSLVRVYRGIRWYRQDPTRVARALSLSVMAHLLAFCAFYLFALAYGESPPLFGIAVIVPIGLLVTAIPLTPAGVGTGHAAFLWLFALLGSERGADIFSLYVLANLLQSAIGGLVYLRFKSDASVNLQHG